MTARLKTKTQILSNLPQNWQRWSSDQASQKLSYGFMIFETSCPLQPIKIGSEAVKQVVSYHIIKLSFHH